VQDKWYGKICYKLFDSRYLDISIDGKKGNGRQPRLRYSIDILSLAPELKENFAFRWSWAVLSLLMLAAGMGYGWYSMQASGINDVADLALTGLPFLVSGASVALFLTKSSKIFQFNTVHGQVTLVKVSTAILGKRKDRLSAHEFAQLLADSIAKSHKQFQVREDTRRAGEIRMLRRLADQGVILRKEYEAKKSLILGSIAAAS